MAGGTGGVLDAVELEPAIGRERDRVRVAARPSPFQIPDSPESASPGER